jgi:hypothetical protein
MNRKMFRIYSQNQSILQNEYVDVHTSYDANIKASCDVTPCCLVHTHPHSKEPFFILNVGNILTN